MRRKDIAPLVNDLIDWMKRERGKLSRHNEVTKAMDYMLKRIDVFTRFLEDGRICLSNSTAERALRGIATLWSLCTPWSSVCKHWKRVFVWRPTRAPLPGDHGFHPVRVQISSTDLVWRASHNLLGRQRAGLDQASDHVGADLKMFCGFRQRQPFTVFFGRSIGVNVAHASHG